MNKKRRRNLRAWVTSLCAAALCLLGVQPTWAISSTSWPPSPRRSEERRVGKECPPSTKVIASDMTAAVVKKDNFGTLTDAAYTLYDTDKVDYVKVELTNAQTGVEYMVAASVRKVPE